jgi:hypothetical protein
MLPEARLAPLGPDAFDLAAAAFETARRTSPNVVQTRYYRVAGRIVRVRIVGPRLAAALAEPCAHLEAADDAEPALAIDVWHEAEAGIPRPGAALDPGLGLYGYMSASKDFRIVAEQRSHSAQWLDRRSQRAIVWVSALNRLCLDERARPFHKLLALRLADFGVQFVHAGLVAWDENGVLFTGKGGSGKSTCSLCCVLDGASYLGDDFIGLEAARDGSFSGHSLYGTALISPAHMTRYPALATACVPGNYPEEEKSVVELGRIAHGRLRAKTTVRAIVLPRVMGARESAFRRISAGEALLALAPSSILYLPGASPKAMERLGALVERVPSYRLELGHDLSQIPVRAKEILAEAQRNADFG